MAIQQQANGLAEVAKSISIMKRNLRGLLLLTGRVLVSFSFYQGIDKHGYENLLITVHGVSIRTAMQSIKRRKNPEKWRGEAFEDSN